MRTDAARVYEAQPSAGGYAESQIWLWGVLAF
jgi:hypothetical protein